MRNEPAFPCVCDTKVWQEVPSGLTKRELFAAMAMQGLCADYGRTTCRTDEVHQNLAMVAVRVADALIAELGKSNDQP